MITLEDRLQIHELLSLYGHVADEKMWKRLSELFTFDAIYDATDFGMPRVVGLENIVDLWMTATVNPLAHHATNVVVTGDTPTQAHVLSKGIGVGNNGRVGSVTYHDIVRRTVDGWRFAERIATLRRPALAIKSAS